MKLSSSALLLSVLPTAAFAFTASPSSKATSLRHDVKLHVGAAWNLGDHLGEEDYDSFVSSNTMMHRAEQCANSEECSLEEAQVCLDEVLHIQSNCVGAGVLSTTDVCGVDTFEILPNVVDKLRLKIQSEQQRLVFVKAGLHFLNIALGTTIVAMILHGLVADPNVPVDMYGNANSAVVPFLPMEVVWSIRDGYFPLLAKEWIQHGGLVVDPSVFEAKAVPITGQEWMWAMDGGSLGRLAQEQMQYGGLRVDPGYDSETTPLQAQEWWWAVRDGYALQAVQHVLRNGGL